MKHSLLRYLPGIAAVLPGLLVLLTLGGCEKLTGQPPALTPAPTALDEPGPHAVERFNTAFQNDIGRYTATVYYPADDNGPFPLVTFSPGLSSFKELHTWVGNHLASHGYVTLIFTVPNPLILKTFQQEAGFASGFDWLDAANDDPASPLFGRLDSSRRAIMGHSLGGMASLYAGAYLDVDAVVSLAPYLIDAAPLQAATVPTQIQASSLDCITTAAAAYDNYQLLAAPTKLIMTINGGNHVSYTDANSIAETVGGRFDCTNLINTADHFHRLSRRYFTGWLNYFVKGDSSAHDALFGDAAQQDRAADLLTVWEYLLP